ncbi:MAG: PTS fructose transporter subunit IIA [Pseudomonadota bacterium]
MIGIVVVAHGQLASEYIAAVEHVVGPLSACEGVKTGDSDDRAGKEQEICAAVDRVDQGDGVVVVTDLFGGSPSNLSLLACKQAQRRIMYGANLPMLIKLAKSRGKPLDEAVEAALDAGRRYINSKVLSHGA